MLRKSFLLLLLFICVRVYAQSPVCVEVAGGKVEGYAEEGITVFKGIPFAAPPVGELRWRPPQPVVPWDSVLKADHFAPACPQPTFYSKMEISEDCLYLNVWTPAESFDEKLPVMVWIYGGGFFMGTTSSPYNDGLNLSKKGVVIVSIAYRVGPLGFLSHPWLSAESVEGVSGNYGLLDQIAGLKWVQENISAFGGDPEKVTIFGESAGGISVSMLCASPLCKGLFRAAICESGGSFGPVGKEKVFGGILNLNSSEQYGIEFAKRMGVTSLEELRKLDVSSWAKDPAVNMGGCWPVVDGYVIADDQYKLYKAGKYNDVDVLIGTNSDEGSMFVKPTSVRMYRKMLENTFGPFATRASELYPAKTRKQTMAAQANIVREIVFAWPTWAWATLQSETGKGNVFLYYFNYPQKMLSFMRGDPNGAGHGSEMRFVFRKLKKNASDNDKLLSETIAAYWTNFAKTGNPNGEGMPYWPVFEEGKTTVQYLNVPVKTGIVPNEKKIQFIDEFMEWKRN